MTAPQESKAMWMVRSGEGGIYAPEFIEKKIVAIGWSDIGDLRGVTDKAALITLITQHEVGVTDGYVKNAASQLVRFRDELRIGDRVVTYDSNERRYHLGTIASDYQHDPKMIAGLANVRRVTWNAEVERDALSQGSKNRLGSTLTLFKIPEETANELRALEVGAPPIPVIDPESDAESALDLVGTAFERTEDRIDKLNEKQLPELVAGLLRAMGYKTLISPVGADRGVDIMASPDGMGFESPRIAVEVKHRKAKMGAPEIRSFAAGRHKYDRGFYVSTGGFTKEAMYEADRADIPIFLMDLVGLAKAVQEHYDQLDVATRALVPLRKVFVPE